MEGRRKLLVVLTLVASALCQVPSSTTSPSTSCITGSVTHVSTKTIYPSGPFDFVSTTTSTITVTKEIPLITTEYLPTTVYLNIYTTATITENITLTVDATETTSITVDTIGSITDTISAIVTLTAKSTTPTAITTDISPTATQYLMETSTTTASGSVTLATTESTVSISTVQNNVPTTVLQSGLTYTSEATIATTFIQSGSTVTSSIIVTGSGAAIIQTASVPTTLTDSSVLTTFLITTISDGVTIILSQSSPVPTSGTSDSILGQNTPASITQTVTSIPTTVSICAVPSNTAPTNPQSSGNDSTWGCSPGYVCNPPKPNHCNIWASALAEDYRCNAQDCIPAPAFEDVIWPENTTAYYPPVEGYYNLNPEAFGLSYEIFAQVVITEYVISDGSTSVLTIVTTGNWASQASLSHYPAAPTANALKMLLERWSLVKRDSSVVPAVCYAQCNNCFIEAQKIGKASALCASGSAFQSDYTSCQACVAAHGDASKLSLQAYVQPEFAQFVNYCNAVAAQSQFAAVAASVVGVRPSVVTVTTGTTTSTSTGPTSTVGVMAKTTVVSGNSSATSLRPQFTGGAVQPRASEASLLGVVVLLGFCFT
ncbi:hypothetical protein BP6252_13530 [Coleophoma cylindrospora]|uniref:Uncharacterized protein n=1 Tax=Coleophoma cylindrospora TaxID=1849047 RepID=A0A3D8Q8I8_9HELO|nr:hypothetical protein BP6252_13530 [Coleophoma cylindrospora]